MIHALGLLDCRLNSNTDLYSSSSGPIFCISQQSLTLEYNSTAGKTSRKSVVRWLDEVYNCFKVRFTNPIEFSQSLKLLPAYTSSFSVRSFTASLFLTPINGIDLVLSWITGRWNYTKNSLTTFALSYQHLRSRWDGAQVWSLLFFWSTILEANHSKNWFGNFFYCR